MRMLVVHTDNHPAATLIAECSDIAQDTLTPVLRSVLSGSVIRNVAVFAFLELNVVFRLTHLLQFCYRISLHHYYFACKITARLCRSACRELFEQKDNRLGQNAAVYVLLNR